jgi:hypothetical protein
MNYNYLSQEKGGNKHEIDISNGNQSKPSNSHKSKVYPVLRKVKRLVA